MMVGLCYDHILAKDMCCLVKCSFVKVLYEEDGNVFCVGELSVPGRK